MYDVQETDAFSEWLEKLRDNVARTRISRRVSRLRRGILGDVKPVGEGVSELRIDYGPGYRVYFLQQGTTLIVLLCGGDKSTQGRDIAAAKRMAKTLREQ